jgi:hypothetical protein
MDGRRFLRCSHGSPLCYAAAHATALSILIPDTYLQHGCLVRDLKSEGASGFSKYYIVGKEIPDLSTQQQGTESILVNSESLLFVDLCYGF